MATNTNTFLLGMGTTFAILAVGFGGGLMMAKTVMEPPAERQTRSALVSSPPVRVILPASAEPAQPPQSSTTAVPDQAAVSPPALPIEEPLVAEKSVEKVDTRKAEAEERERRKRYAERKAKRSAERAKRQQQIAQGERRDLPIIAFGGDEARQSVGVGFLGN